jgi:hypothetical protein
MALTFSFFYILPIGYMLCDFFARTIRDADHKRRLAYPSIGGKIGQKVLEVLPQFLIVFVPVSA